MTTKAAETPAGLPTFLTNLDLALVDKHPKNPRHSASADPDLVESIKISGLVQPIVVAPHPQTEGRYVLIAGHRRVDGCKKAKRKNAPAVIRHDLATEDLQIVAMLTENDHREDLTAIEQAESYEELALFGYKQAAIAKAVGRDPKTISTRLKLLKLTKKVQSAVHDGQLSMDDAISIGNLHPKEQPAAQKVAGTPEFKYTLEAAKRRSNARRDVEAKIAKLTAAGVPQKTTPKGVTEWHLTDAAHGMTRLGQTFSNDPDQHVGCLAFIEAANHRYGGEVVYVCTNIAGHDDQLADEQKARNLAHEQEQAEFEARRVAREIAKQLRTTAIYDQVKPGLKLDPTLSGIIRALLPTLISRLEFIKLEDYLTAMSITAGWEGSTYRRKAADAAAFRAHVRELDEGSDYLLAKSLTAVLVATVDDTVLLQSAHQSDPWSALAHTFAERYLTLAVDSGHTLTEIDEGFLTIARGDAPTQADQ